jgi:adenine-specific DNA-methyltransferase
MWIATLGQLQEVEPLLDQVDLLRVEAGRRIDPSRRSELGQFLTPPSVARFMASLFGTLPRAVRVLDAGAGVGTLFSAVMVEAAGQKKPPRDFQVTAYEIDPVMAGYLDTTMGACRVKATTHGIRFHGGVIRKDFIGHAVDELQDGSLTRSKSQRFTHAILNPPYKKLSAGSSARLALRRVGIEASNLYAAFLALAVRLLDDGGELVAITPRSFCNGPYFRTFRKAFLGAMSLRRIHVFESRTAAFSDDDVLQENVIIHAIKGKQSPRVVVSSSAGPDDGNIVLRTVPFESIVSTGDPEQFIHVVPDEIGQQAAELFARFDCTLADLDLEVSTGRVVDFRAKSSLRQDPDLTTGPLIYPTHLQDGAVAWPKASKKPNALVDCAETANLWMPSGTYVLVKRFSSKEEKRRVVAAVFNPEVIPAKKVGFENHLNVFHTRGAGLAPDLARGLSTFLNSSLVDTCFRHFSGHTQVNATDLRNMKYPSATVLRELGKRLRHKPVSQNHWLRC